MGGFSFLGEPAVVLAIGLAGFISAVGRGQKTVQQAFIYAAAAFGFSVLLKQILHRRRPDNLDIRTLGVKSYSFPSGHAVGTVIFYGLFSYLDFKYLLNPLNYTVALLLWITIVMIGISRVYLRYHYPSDVVAGWLLGLVSLIIVIQTAF